MTTEEVLPTKISDLRPGWIGDAHFRVVEEVVAQSHSKGEDVNSKEWSARTMKEFVVGDSSAKITFRCSDKREAEMLKLNEAYHLKSGKIEMSRGQMRLMTDRVTYDKSAVHPSSAEAKKRNEVCEAKDCGKLNLSALFFDKIQWRDENN